MSNIPEYVSTRLATQRRNVPERMLTYCADRRRKADELQKYGEYEAYEDFENLFTQVSEALENETADTVEELMESMRDALADTVKHIPYDQSIEETREWCRKRADEENLTRGEAIVYTDLLHLYGYLSALYSGAKRPELARQVNHAVGDLYVELRHRLERSHGVYAPIQTVS